MLSDFHVSVIDGILTISVPSEEIFRDIRNSKLWSISLPLSSSRYLYDENRMVTDFYSGKYDPLLVSSFRNLYKRRYNVVDFVYINPGDIPSKERKQNPHWDVECGESGRIYLMWDMEEYA